MAQDLRPPELTDTGSATGPPPISAGLSPIPFSSTSPNLSWGPCSTHATPHSCPGAQHAHAETEQERPSLAGRLLGSWLQRWASQAGTASSCTSEGRTLAAQVTANCHHPAPPSASRCPLGLPPTRPQSKAPYCPHHDTTPLQTSIATCHAYRAPGVRAHTRPGECGLTLPATSQAPGPTQADTSLLGTSRGGARRGGAARQPAGTWSTTSPHLRPWAHPPREAEPETSTDP